MRKRICWLVTLVLLLQVSAWAVESSWEQLGLQYPDRGFISETSAEKWDHSLITGNGTIGVSVPGHVPNDDIVLSHERLFLPAYKPMDPPALGPHLEHIRGLILAGRHIEASRFAWQLGQDMGYPPIAWTNPFVPACVLHVEMGGEEKPGQYARSVDFETGEAVVAWEHGGEIFHRKVFVSRPAGIAAMLIDSPSGAKIDATFRLAELPREKKKMLKYELDDVIEGVAARAEGNWLTYSTRFKSRWEGALRGAAAAARVVASGGGVESKEGAIRVTGANKILILVDVDVFWQWPSNGADALKPGLKQIQGDYAALLDDHAALHGKMFRRTRLELGASADRRLSAEALQNGSAVGALSPALVAKLFDAARYNIICSTGELPPTLQGIWGATWYPPWSGDFTQDGNVQSAIDGGLNCNIPEVTRAYLDYMTALLDDFRANARDAFDCEGIWVPSRTSDHGRIYHFSERFPGLFWMAGAAWVSQYYYDYWLYTGDKAFLEKQAIPFMLESAAFYEDYLYLGADGKYIVNPSYSPEIWPLNLPEWSNATVNATMDVASIKGLLRNLLALADETPFEPARIKKWKDILAKTPDYAIDPDTEEFKEWLRPDYKNYNAHRHASHFYPLFFGLDPEIAENPVLIESCRKAIDARMEFRRGEKGGTMAFGIVQKGMAAAHIKDAELAYECVDLLCNKFWTRALGSLHNARGGFNLEISGGMPAVIAEMLAQSAPGKIELLPVLPEEWPDGRVQGLRARGGFQLDITWSKGKLETATVKSLLGKPCRIHYGEIARDINLKKGESARLGPDLR